MPMTNPRMSALHSRMRLAAMQVKNLMRGGYICLKESSDY